MGAKGYAKKPRKSREEKAGPALECVRHPRRRAAVWASFGKAPGMGMCDACHGCLIGKWTDDVFRRAVHGDRAAAQRVVLDTLEKEVS